ncbi:hypothetical protein SADUNF_Sadunf08G0116200 [Salix dunnii]|uniref:Uncharacterized protein n=1 Tax=Salix dunnii TaxID=1413687 RepID=A0A835JU36_9ROSI|nr:hypothetical protein SADUNF_Sadunf08G0116200 [Salix dunnii]
MEMVEPKLMLIISNFSFVFYLNSPNYFMVAGWFSSWTVYLQVKEFQYSYTQYQTRLQVNWMFNQTAFYLDLVDQPERLAIINGWRLFQGCGWKMSIAEVMNAGYSWKGIVVELKGNCNTCTLCKVNHGIYAAHAAGFAHPCCASKISPVLKLPTGHRHGLHEGKITFSFIQTWSCRSSSIHRSILFRFPANFPSRQPVVRIDLQFVSSDATNIKHFVIPCGGIEAERISRFINNIKIDASTRPNRYICTLWKGYSLLSGDITYVNTVASAIMYAENASNDFRKASILLVDMGDLKVAKPLFALEKRERCR